MPFSGIVAQWKTGVSGTINYSGSISTYLHGYTSFPGNGAASWNSSGFIGVGPLGQESPNPAIGIQWDATVSGSIFLSAAARGLGKGAQKTGAYSPDSGVSGGAYGISIDYEEWAVVYNGGTSFAIYRAPKPGGSYNIFITLGGYTASAVGSIAASASGVQLSEIVCCGAYQDLFVVGGTYVATTQINGNFPFQNYANSQNFSNAVQNETLAGSISPTQASMTITITDSEVAATMYAEGQASVSYDFEARLKCFNDDYPGAQTIKVFGTQGSTTNIAASPTASLAITQRYFDAGWTSTRFSFGPQGFNEIIPVSAQLVTPDDPTDIGLFISGTPYPSFTLAQATSLVVANAQSSLGPLTITQNNWEGYRYLQFTADQDGTLNITSPVNSGGIVRSYVWSVATPGTAQTITLDLCLPNSWTGTADHSIGNDARPSRYPIYITSQAQGNPIGGPVLESAPNGALMGISAVGNAALAVSTPVNLGQMTLIRKLNSKVTFSEFRGGALLPTPDASQIIGWTIPSAPPLNVYITPYCTLESDGRLVVDLPSTWSFPGTNNATTGTIDDLISWINYFPGWTATSLHPAPADGWHTNTRNLIWAWGDGAVYYGMNWHDGCDVDVSGTLVTVYAQALYSSVQVYAGVGDCWEGTGRGNATPIRISKHLRGASWGLVFDPSSRNALSGATVTSVVQGAGDSGDGVTDVQGEYKTGLTYQPGGKTIATQVATNSITGVARNGFRRRASFVKIPGTGGSHMISSPPRLFHYVAPYTNSDGQSALLCHTWDLYKTRQTKPICANLGYTILSAQITFNNGALIVVYGASDGNVYGVESSDWGTTWGTPQKLWAGQKPAICTDNFGTDYCLTYETGNGWRLRMRLLGSAWQDQGILLTDSLQRITMTCARSNSLQLLIATEACVYEQRTQGGGVTKLDTTAIKDSSITRDDKNGRTFVVFWDGTAHFVTRVQMGEDKPWQSQGVITPQSGTITMSETSPGAAYNTGKEDVLAIVFSDSSGNVSHYTSTDAGLSWGAT